MTTVVSVVSAKGGAGKTILSLSMARFLGGLGYKVLVVDADAATNGATLFLLEEVVDWAEAQDGRRLRGVFEPVTAVADGFDIMSTSLGFDLFPAAYRLRDTVRESAERADDEPMQFLVRQLRESDYDVVIVDNEAGIERTAVSTAAVSDRVVIVSELDPVSAQGVARLQRLHADVLPEGDTWILYNKVLAEFADSVPDVLAAMKILAPVTWTADVVRRYVVGELDVDPEKPSDFTLAIANTVEVLFGRKVRERVRRWRTVVAERFRLALEARREVLLGQVRPAPPPSWARDIVWNIAPVVVGTAAGLASAFATGTNITALVWAGVVLTATLAVGIGRLIWSESARRGPADIDVDTVRSRLNEVELLLTPIRLDDPDLRTLRDRLRDVEAEIAQRVGPPASL